MIDSIFFLLVSEPGFYLDGEFGIRIENLVRIIPARPKQKFKDIQFLTFENLTFVPIQQKMVVPEMLTKEEVSFCNIPVNCKIEISILGFPFEVAFINEYHSQCRDKVAPLLLRMNKKEAHDWLMKETMQLG